MVVVVVVVLSLALGVLSLLGVWCCATVCVCVRAIARVALCSIVCPFTYCINLPVKLFKGSFEVSCDEK